MRIWRETEPLDNSVREGRREYNVIEQPLSRWRRQWGAWKCLGRSIYGRWCDNTALKWRVGELTLDSRILTGRIGA